MNAWTLLFDIVILLGAALFAGILFGRLRQNAIVGYLLAGILLGRAGSRVVVGGPAIEAIAELGVALLLFSIGLEFSWSRLRKFGAMAAGAGSLQVGVTMAAFAGLTLALGFQVSESLVIGAATALSSTAVVLRVLTDRGEMDSRHGRNGLAILLLQDVAVVPLVLLVDALTGGSGMESVRSFTIKIAQGGGLVFGMVIVSRYVLPKLLVTASSFRNRDLPILLAVCVFLLSTWASHALGLSPVLGAFVAGMLLAETPFAEQIRADVTPLRAAFVTIFFTSIGMLVERPTGDMAWKALVLAAIILVVKAGLITVVVRLFRRPWPEALRTGLTLAQIGEFSFVLAEIAYKNALITESNFQILLSASLLTLLATPYLIALASRQIVRGGRRVGEKPAGAFSEPQRVIVIGYGPAGRAVVAALEKSGTRFLVLELNPTTVASYRSAIPIELGDSTQRYILEHSGLETAAALVVTIPDTGTVRMIIRQAKAVAPGVPVIVRARQHIYAESLLEAGADALVDEEEIVGGDLAARLETILAAEKQTSAGQ